MEWKYLAIKYICFKIIRKRLMTLESCKNKSELKEFGKIYSKKTLFINLIAK